jgi:competence transcription factor ComK
VKQSKETIDIKQFVPIVIDDRSNIILFPDSSPHNHDVVWYSALMIDTFINDDDDEFVMFRNRELFHISQNYDAAKKRFSFSLHLNHRLKNEQLMF